MQYIKVLATTSTNTDLKQQYRADKDMPNTCLSANHQTSGRGQRGSSWNDEPGKNLTISILIKDINIKTTETFKVNAIICLSLAHYLNKHIKTNSFLIKWPNDILSGHQKVCGILIENILSHQNIKHSVIGIGLNVNQTHFSGLKKATSLKNITKKTYHLDKMIVDLAEQIEQDLLYKKDEHLHTILAEYENYLYGLNQTSLFEFPDGTQAKGIIKGVESSGLLTIQFEDQLKHFNLKEIKMIY